MSKVKESGIIRIDATNLHQHRRKMGVRPLERLVASIGKGEIENRQITRLPEWFVSQVYEALPMIAHANYGVIIGRDKKQNPLIRETIADEKRKIPEKISSNKGLESISANRRGGFGITNGAIVYHGLDEGLLLTKAKVGVMRIRHPGQGRGKSSLLTKERSISWEFHRSLVNGDESVLLIPISGQMDTKKRSG